MLLWTVGTNIGKQEIYQLLRIEQPTHPERDGYPTGYCHWPEYDESWFRGITAEQIVPKVVRGYRKYVWEQIPGRPNEPLDCRNYARAAGASLGLFTWTEDRWDTIEKQLGRPPAKKKRRPSSKEGRFSRWHGPSRSTSRFAQRSPREL